MSVLLLSLLHSVNIVIRVDASEFGQKHESKLRNVQNTRLLSQKFAARWEHGDVRLYSRSAHVGLAHQWIEAWFPLSNSEYVLVLEDDLEVSSISLVYLTKAVQFYRSNTAVQTGDDLQSRMAGITLQRAEVIAALKWASFTEAKTDELPLHYGFQQPGSWGQLFFPEHWREFRIWLEEKVDGRQFNIDGSPSHVRPHTGFPDDEWTRPWMRFIYERGYFVLYSHIPQNQALVLNHLEPGVHYSKKGESDVILLDTDMGGRLYEFPSVAQLRVWDIWGMELFEDGGWTGEGQPALTHSLTKGVQLEIAHNPHGAGFYSPNKTIVLFLLAGCFATLVFLANREFNLSRLLATKTHRASV